MTRFTRWKLAWLLKYEPQQFVALLYELCGARTLRLIRYMGVREPVDSDDILQNTWLAISRVAYDQRLSDVDDYVLWAMGVCANQVRRFFRSRRSNAQLVQAFLERDNFLQSNSNHEIQQLALSAFTALRGIASSKEKVQKRCAAVILWMAGFTTKEISAHLGIKHKTIQSWVNEEFPEEWIARTASQSNWMSSRESITAHIAAMIAAQEAENHHRASIAQESMTESGNSAIDPATLTIVHGERDE